MTDRKDPVANRMVLANRRKRRRVINNQTIVSPVLEEIRFIPGLE